MTSGPTHDDAPPPGSHPGGGPTPETNDSWAVLSGTERSDAEETPTDNAETSPEPVRRSRVWPRIVGVLILLVGVGAGLAWENPGFVRHSLGSWFPESVSQNADAAAIAALQIKVAGLEQRPGTEELAARLDALEKRTTSMAQASASQPAVDLRPLLARLDALEARSRGAAAATGSSAPSTGAPAGGAPSSGADLSPLFARLDGVAAAQNSDSARIDAIAAQIGALAAREPDIEFRGKLDELAKQLSDLSTGETKLAEASDRAMRIGRLDAAAIALAAGRPLGPMPDAPAALARFATAAPPTEAGLRLAFDPASQAALKVSQPDTEDKPFLDRVMARLQDSRLITVREGDHVLVGNSTATTLVHARTLLDAGDLDGAVKAVSSLTGPPAEKMAAWLADAKSLQEAREALAALQGTG